MSQTIDQKVVEMRFDNTQFEKAVSDTQKTLKDFKSDIDLEKDALKFSKLGDTVDAVKVKFSALEVVAVTALANITNRIVDTGIQLAKSLSIDQISAGFQKYEDKTTAVQTIMSATGKEIEEVEGELERLNWFTDETSYNFVDMVSNIGKFTSAGVELNKAVDAMQGISTWAALSGANAEQASRAMYNLSQAMGTGVVKVQDWMSIENANMATKEFKQMVIDTAYDLKTLDKDADGIFFAPGTKKGTDVTVENFRSTLAEGWFTSDVLTAVLERYGKFSTNLNALSNDLLEGEYETTSTLISYIEDYKDETDGLSKDDILARYAKKTGKSIEELREQFDALANDELGLKAFKAAQEAKTFSEAINSVKDAVSTGWMNSFQKIFGNYEQAKRLWTDLANELWDIFASGAEDRNEILDIWAEGGGQEHIHDIIIGLTTLVKDFKEAWSQAMEAVFGSSDNETKANKLLSFTEKIRDFIQNLALFERDEEGEIVGLTKKGEKVVEVFKVFLTVIRTIGKIFIKVFKVAWKIVKNVWSVLKVLFDGIKAFFTGFKSFFDVKRLLKKARIDALEQAGKKLAKPMSLFEKIAAKFREWTSRFDKSKFLDAMWVWGHSCAIFLMRAWNFIKKIPEKINSVFTKLFGFGIGEAIQKLWNHIKAFFKWLQDQHIFSTIWNGIKTFFEWVWNGLKTLLKVDNFGQLVDKIKGIFGKIFEFIKNIFSSLFSGVSKSDEKKAEEKEGETKSILQSLFGFLRNIFEFVLSVVNTLLKSIDLSSIMTSVSGILKTLFQGIATVLTSIDWKQLLVGFIGASSLLKTINKLRIGKAIVKFAEGFADFADAIGDFADAAKKASKALKWKFIADMLKSLALLIAVVAASIFILGTKMSESEMSQGMAALIVMFAGLIILIKSMQSISAKQASSQAAVFLSLAISMLVIVKVIEKMTKLDPDKMLTSTVAVMGLMALMALMVAMLMKISSDSAPKKLLAVSVLFIAIGLVISSLGKTIGKLTKLDPDRMVQSTLAVLAVMAVMSALVAILMVASNKAKPKKLLSVAVLFAVIGIVVAAISKAIVKLAGIDADKMLTATLAVLSVMIVMAALVAVLMVISNTTKPKKLLSVATLFVAIGVVVNSLTKSVSRLASLDGSSMTNSVIAVLAIMVVMAALVAILMVISNTAKPQRLNSVAVLFLAIGAAVLVLAIAMSVIASLDSTKMALAMLAITAFMVEMLLLMVVASKMNPAKMIALALAMVIASSSIIVLAIGLMMLVPVINALAKIPTKKLLKALLVIAGLFAILTIAGIVVKKALPGLLGLAAFFLVISASVLIFATAIAILGPALTVLATAILFLIDVVLENADDMRKAFIAVAQAFIDAMVVIVQAAGTVITALFDSLTQSLPAIVDFINAVIKSVCDIITEAAAPLMNALKVLLLSTIDMLWEVLPVLIEFVLDILDQLLAAIADHIQPIMESIMRILIGIIQAIANYAEPLIKAIIDLVGNLLKGLANNIGGLINPLVDLIVAVLVSLGSNLGRIVGAAFDFLAILVTELVSGLDKILSPLADGISNIISDVVSAPLSGLMKGVGKGLNDFANSAKDFFEIVKDIDPGIFNALGQLGAFIISVTASSVIDGITKLLSFGQAESPLKKFGRELKDFADPLVEFTQKVRGKVNPSDVESVASAAKTMSALYENLPKEGGWVQKIFGETMSLGTFGQQLKEFAQGFKMFYNEIKDLDVKQALVESVANAAKTMAALYNNLPKSGGWMQVITGETMSLDTFGQDLKKFAQGFKMFYNEIKTIDVKQELVNTVTNTAKIFAELYNTLPKEGGWVNKVFGEAMSLDSFGQDLQKFAKGFKMFYNEISTITVDATKIDSVANAAKMMAALYDNLPLEGGLMQSIFGETMSLDTFGKDMENFAKGFVGFATEIEGATFTDAKINSAITVAKAMTEIYKTLTADNLWDLIVSWLDKLTGNSNPLKKFGAQMVTFAGYLKQFNDKILEGNMTETELHSMDNYVTMMGNFVYWLANSADSKNAGTNLTNLANGLLTLTDSMKTAGSNQEWLQQFEDSGYTLGGKIVYGFSKALDLNRAKASNLPSARAFAGAIPQMATQVANEVNLAFQGSEDATSPIGMSLMAAGTRILKGIVAGVATQAGRLASNTQWTNARSKFASDLDNYFSSAIVQVQLNTTGKHIVEGIVQGIVNNMSLAYAAGQKIYQNVDSGTRNEGVIHSPSMAMYQNGVYVVQGFVNGIRDNLYTAEMSGESIADNALDGFQRAMLTANDYITDSLDGPLTLTPVLDLSEIQNGTSQLSQMMSSMDGYQLDGSMRFASNAYTSRPIPESVSQSASVDRLTNAIEDMLQNPQNNFANTFNINGTNAREIAEEVSRILQMQVERRQAVWG